jgi:hypothetical protein
VAALRADVLAEVAQIRLPADRRIGESLARVDTDLVKAEELRTCCSTSPFLATHTRAESAVVVEHARLPAFGRGQEQANARSRVRDPPPVRRDVPQVHLPARLVRWTQPLATRHAT